MPRGPRIQCEGMVFHVVVRGVARAPIFFDDEDREDLLGRFDRVFPESGARCLAWALIPNHFHLVLRTGPTALSRLMSRVETGFARRFNERHGRVGHLFQNRFLSRAVDDDGDLQGLIRYVHANPMRHGLVPDVDSLSSFAWCGHAALVGVTQPRRFHAVDTALEAFGPTRSSARRSLVAWMAREAEPRGEPRTEDADPDARLQRASSARRRAVGHAFVTAELATLVEVVAARLGVEAEALRGPSKAPAAVEGRALAAYLAGVHGASNSAIARALQVSERSAARGAALGARLARARGGLVEDVRAALGESPDRRERPRQ